MSKKTAVLLINVGTPDKPKVRDVRRYLTQFLNDRRVIDLPWLQQKLLVNLIIVPFRSPKSTKLYKMLWTDKGSPLLLYTEQVCNKLGEKLGSDYEVFGAMRYQNPSIKKALREIKKKGFKQIIVLPMFPQYASSTTGTAIQEVMRHVRKWNVIPEIRFINQFYDHPGYYNAFLKRAGQYNLDDYDHILFSYHGLPNNHLHKAHPEVDFKTCTCSEKLPVHGQFCYKATCYETTRILASKMGLGEDKYTVTFQSRLSKNWLTPFTDDTIVQKAKEGTRKLLVFAPAFVADCIETIIEIKIEYGELFKEHGGQHLEMVESLNGMDEWVEGLKQILT